MRTTVVIAVATMFLIGAEISLARSEESNEAERATQLCDEHLAAGIGAAERWIPQSRVDTLSVVIPALPIGGVTIPETKIAEFKWTNSFDGTRYINSEREITWSLPGFSTQYNDIRGVCIGYGAEVQNFMKTRRGSK